MKIPQPIKENRSAAYDSRAAYDSSICKENQNDPAKNKLQDLEKTIVDPTTSCVDKTRARLELALLQGDNSNKGQARIKKEIDAIKRVADVAKATVKVEQGISTTKETLQRESSIQSQHKDSTKKTVQRQEDAKRRATEQRKRATDAQELLSRLEIDAEEAIAKAKDAMKRANDAWVEAGREQRKALELEAQNDEIQELQSMKNAVVNKEEESTEQGNVLNDESPQRIPCAGEGYFTKYFKLSIKVEDLQKDRDELDARLKERETTIENLRSKYKLHEEKIMSLNKLHEEEVTSLNDYVKETGQTLLYWKHRSKILVKKLQMSRRRKSEQEGEVMIMKDQLVIKLQEIDELKAEIEDLRQTKTQFEAELPTVEGSQRSNFLQLKVEADALLEDKEHSLNTLRIVNNSYSKVVEHYEEQINVAGDDIATFEKELGEVKEKEKESVAESDRIQNDEVKQLKEECSRWKKKATNLNHKLDVLKEETQSQKREIVRLKKSADQDRLFSRLVSDHKLLKKKSKVLQLNLCVVKKEVKERDAKVKERDAIIEELKKDTDAGLLHEGAGTGQKSATYWKYGKII